MFKNVPAQAQPQNTAGPHTPIVSVIIPALNEERTITKCLGALCKMDFDHQDFEVIVVDNGSCDDTVSIARSFANILNLIVLEHPGLHISALRNRGAAKARGQVLAFLDADCVPSPTWMHNFMARLTSAKTEAIVGAHYRIPQNSSWVARSWYGGMDSIKTGEVNYVPSGDLILYAATFHALGGFDETIQTNEDAELCRRARRRAVRVLAYPDLAIEHLGTPQTVPGFYQKHRWHGKHVFKVFLRSGGSENLKSVGLAMYTLATLAITVVGFVLAVLTGKHGVLLGGTAGLVLLFITLGFSEAARRHRLRATLPLIGLTFLYALARSVCLLDLQTWLVKSGPSQCIPPTGARYRRAVAGDGADKASILDLDRADPRS